MQPLPPPNIERVAKQQALKRRLESTRGDFRGDSPSGKLCPDGMNQEQDESGHVWPRRVGPAEGTNADHALRQGRLIHRPLLLPTLCRGRAGPCTLGPQDMGVCTLPL